MLAPLSKGALPELPPQAWPASMQQRQLASARHDPERVPPAAMKPQRSRQTQLQGCEIAKIQKCVYF